MENVNRIENLLKAIAGLGEIPDYPESGMSRVEKLLMYIAKNSSAGGVAVIKLEGDQGTLTKEEFDLMELSPERMVVFENNTEYYYLSSIQESYRVFCNIDRVTGTTADAHFIYVNTSPEAVNYRSWTKESA